MKSLILTVIATLLCVSATWADSPPWTGDLIYTFSGADPYFVENSISDTATVNIIGGAFGSLSCYAYSTVNMSAGTGQKIRTADYSTVNLTGGDIQGLSAINVLFEPNYSQFHIYALDYVIGHNTHFSGYYDINGHWEDGTAFDILVADPSWPNVTVHRIPEPCACLLLAAGALFLKRRLP